MDLSGADRLSPEARIGEQDFRTWRDWLGGGVWASDVCWALPRDLGSVRESWAGNIGDEKAFVRNQN